ncbi:TM2 domain-containing protein (plasmid) [Streptomyces sp. BI20]|uniref:TM2 domain-containing protein n=1 Tax=Streptomyces sp. BI20 TaxID=3403460 RepID=UPI003C7763B9
MSDQQPYQPYGQPQQPQQPQPYGQPQQQPYGQAPYGQQPGQMQPYGASPYGQSAAQTPPAPEVSDKSKVVAGVLQFFLGCFGAGRFYTGHTGMAIAQLLTCGGVGVWALVDSIMFFVSNDRTDAKGRPLRG